MPDTKISALTAGVTPVGANQVVGLATGADVIWTFNQIMTSILTLLGDTDGTLAANSDLKFATQKALRTYVAANLTGLQLKSPVRAMTTANGTLATSFANGQTIDGIVLVTGDRILLKDQTTGSENGIYTVAASGAPTRATDGNTGALMVNASMQALYGTVNARSKWTCTTPATITLGSTSLSFVQTDTGTTASDLQGDGLTSAQAGFRNIPQRSVSADTTIVAADSGGQIFHPTADATPRTWTIPANSALALPIGAAITYVVQSGAGAVTIAITSDVMRLAGAGTTGSRMLAANGIATSVKVTATEWIISGSGLS